MDENATENQQFLSPKKKRSLSPILWLTAIFLVGAFLGNLLWLFAADVLAFGNGETEVEFTVSATDNLKSIARNLKKQGLIDYAWLFRLYASVTGSAEKIRAGTYTLSTRYDYHALVKVLSSETVHRSASYLNQSKEL